MASKVLKKTPLYNIHVNYGGKLVDYANFSMPVLYPKIQSHIESHNWVRSNSGLFDVSHMLQHKLSGKDALSFLHKITPTDFSVLGVGKSQLSVLLNENGGIIDDTIITKYSDNEFYIVTNAGCIDKDLTFLKNQLDAFQNGNHNINHKIFNQETASLIALQGPKSSEILQKIFPDINLSTLFFSNSAFFKINNDYSKDSIKYNSDSNPILKFEDLFLNESNHNIIHIARCGYTGEDGFEISIPNPELANHFTNLLLNLSNVKPIGLATRDSLRLEAGMCLYGHELSESITPIEANLNWLVCKDFENSTYNGNSKIVSQLSKKEKVLQRRVGFTLLDKSPAARENVKIFSNDDPEKQIGYVTSGSYSPTLKVNIGQAYINPPFNKKTTKILLEVRGKKRLAEVSKLPFVPPNYYRG
ncbi:glycine decarboxylase subunit T [Ascoidea rubescens DSM 1968]|uniref:Aminomethyltransferase n=1 Tax=Ascoidea rubescens DSM 1968 TaxID=1344418 RepID=A0A1D2VPP8_9ASCO|nr:glycine cleavage system T protein [Ascoidea rubescens DSM 1968]ODV63527.1 glycine cleavage system T protein [Ascoidea rubescens DSM 1968]